MRVWVVVCVLACASTPALAAKVNLPGQVTYTEHVALPAGATLRLQLVDESLPTAPPRLDVEGPIGSGQVPLSFTLTFEDAIIIPDHTYGLIAAISGNGGLLFRNFEPYIVNPLAPASPVTIVTSLVGTKVAETIDSASSAAPDSSASSAADTAPPVLDTAWMATDIAGAAIVPRNTPNMTIGADMHAGGSGGCTSWSAQAVFAGDTLRFGGVTATRKACGGAVDAEEKAFFAAIAATASWRLSGNTLTFYGADGGQVASFRR